MKSREPRSAGRGGVSPAVDAVLPAAAAAPERDHPAGDGRTREAVARLLMERGPVAAAEVAEALGLSGPAVRRHLDALIADGEARVVQAARRGPRGRGRPARHYALTDTGRARFGHGYDDLAVSAMRYLREYGGEPALTRFAQNRVADLIGPGAAQIAAASGPQGRADALASVLTARGYAAQARSAGAGVQLCQHHCPVARVAAEFPQLCEAETRAFAELLGTHVQRLATIARGDAACTTHVPPPSPRTAGARSPAPPDTPESTPPSTGHPTTTPDSRTPIGRQSE